MINKPLLFDDKPVCIYYQSLTEQFEKEKPSEECFELYTDEKLLQPAEWFKALALWEYAFLNTFDGEKTHDFFGKIFRGYDINAAIDLNDTDYDWYWNKIHSLLEQYCAINPKGYVEKAMQYYEGRRNYKDNSLALHYLQKGVEEKAENAYLVYGYFLYAGILTEANPEEGKMWMEKVSSPFYKQNLEIYKASIATQENHPEEAKTILEKLEQQPLEEDIYSALYEQKGILADNEGNYVESLNFFKKGMANSPTGLMFERIGAINYNQKQTLENPLSPAECLEMIEKAFRRGRTHNIRGIWYLLTAAEEELRDIDKGIEWLKKAVLYNEAFAAYELALIYLDNDHYKDIPKGLELLDFAIELKYPQAHETKAYYYFEGIHFEKDLEKSFLHLHQAMDLGYGAAAYRLGQFQEQGTGNENGEPNYKKALEFYEKAAELGYIYGYERAGYYHMNGYAGEENIEKCLSYYEAGSSYGSPYCKVELGIMHLNGNGVEENNELAFSFFKEAAEREYIPAYYFLGRCYKYKWGTEENPDKAFEAFEKAANDEHIQSMAELALCYEQGYGTEENGRKALLYMKKAAEKEYAYAQYKVGCYYLYGMEGVPTNHDEAFTWLSKAVENEYPHAYLELGDYYFYDYNDTDEEEKAYSLYEKAFKQGVLNEGLGLCFYYGIGVEENEGEGFKYLLKAAEEDCIRAEFEVARCYYYGRGIQQNYEEAYRWFDDAANYGHRTAIYFKAKMLVAGEGVIQNLEEGVELMRTAAERGSSDAQYELGNYYLVGKGVEENGDMAMEWFEQAADNGHKQALKITGRSRRK